MPPKVPRAARTLSLSLIAPLSLEVASPNWVDAFPLEDSIGLFVAISFLNCATAALASVGGVPLGSQSPEGWSVSVPSQTIKCHALAIDDDQRLILTGLLEKRVGGYKEYVYSR